MAIDLRNKYKVTWELNNDGANEELVKYYRASGFDITPNGQVVFVTLPPRPNVTTIGQDQERPQATPVGVAQGFISLEIVEEDPE